MYSAAHYTPEPRTVTNAEFFGAFCDTLLEQHDAEDILTLAPDYMVDEIAPMVRLPHWRVEVILRRAGVKAARKINVRSKLPITRILRQHINDGTRVTHIARMYGVTPAAVCNRMKRDGIRALHRGKRRALKAAKILEAA